MKVMHFVGYYPPERAGGVGEFVAGLHKSLQAAGHESLVVTAGHESTPTVYRISQSALGWFLKTALWARRAAECDIVHCQGGEALPLLLMLSLRRRKCKVLATFHSSYGGIAGSFAPYSIEDRTFASGLEPWVYRNVICTIHRVLDWATIRLADHVNAVSRASARDVGAKDATVIYCGLEEAGDPPEAWPVEILYAGRPGHLKRVNVLPYVLERVRAQVPRARLRIVGFELDAEPELRALFDKRGLLPHVDCAGLLRSAELASHYRSALCAVIPSAYEGLPLVMLEAMQCGLPVVATRVSGHPEAIEDGVNGFLTDVDAPGQMADRCIRLIEDPTLRRRIGDEAKTTAAERFGMKRQLDEYLALYGSLCGEARRNG